MDIPDLAVMSAPNACMVVVEAEDPLFPHEGKMQAKADTFPAHPKCII